MEDRSKYLKLWVALTVTGSAILFFSCVENGATEQINEETLISRVVDSMSWTTTRNGKKTNLFITPKLEAYEFAKVPFTEYRMGVEVIAYNDSTGMQSMHVTSDYALHWTDRDLWELKGNVVVEGENDRTLRSQQLMWDRKIEKIYSNVDSKVEEGNDVFIGEGFEAKDDFSRWTFRRLKGRVGVNVDPASPEPAAADSLPAPEIPAAPAAGITPVQP